MQIKPFLAAIALAALASAPQAAVTIFNTAFLAPAAGGPDGGIVLNGFGRNTSTLATADAGSQLGGAPLLPYFDTWNLGTMGVTPGLYNFASLVVDADPGTFFTGITFNSIDAAGVRNTILFSLNAGNTQAVGSGTFTVRASCPIQSCVWIDVIGLRPEGAPWGYGGGGTALPVPEPTQWALLAAGLAGLGVALRRRTAGQRQAAGV